MAHRFARPGRWLPAVLLTTAIACQPGLARAIPNPVMGVRSQSTAQDLIASQTGAQWVGVGASWTTLEPEQGVFPAQEWNALAQRVQQLHASGVRVFVGLTGAPSWATAPHKYPGYQGAPDPARVPDYASLLRQLSTRLGPDVDAWSVWNEPNNYAFFDRPDAAAWVTIQKAGYTAIKAGDPSSIVVAGPAVTIPDTAPDKWLAKAYASGLRGYADVISVNHYPMGPPEFTDRKANGTLRSASWLGSLDDIRAVIQRRDPGRKLWITEFSWSSCSQDNTLPWGICVTRDQQADYLTRGSRLLRRYAPWVTNAFWYEVQDNAPAVSWYDTQGLVDTAGQPKPAWDAFHALATGAAVPSLPTGTAPERPSAAGGRVRLGPLTLRYRREGTFTVTTHLTAGAGGAATRVVISATTGVKWQAVATTRTRGDADLSAVIRDRGFTAVRVSASPAAGTAPATRVRRIPDRVPLSPRS